MGRRDFRLASLPGLLPSAKISSPLSRNFGSSGTDPVGPHPHQNKNTVPQKGNCIFGWGGGISELLRSLDCFRQPKILRLRLAFLGRQVRTRCVLILAKIKNRPLLRSNLFFWLGRRDSDPRDAGVKVLCLTAWRRPNVEVIVKTPTVFLTMGESLLYGVEGGIRTHGLQSHNLTR